MVLDPPALEGAQDPGAQASGLHNLKRANETASQSNEKPA